MFLLPSFTEINTVLGLWNGKLSESGKKGGILINKSTRRTHTLKSNEIVEQKIEANEGRKSLASEDEKKYT